MRASRRAFAKTDPHTNSMYILQSGFAEGIQLRCGEAYLEKLTGYLGCEYAGTLVKGDNFSIRFFDGEMRNRVTGPYTEMGREYAANAGFNTDKCKAFTGHEILPVHSVCCWRGPPVSGSFFGSYKGL